MTKFSDYFNSTTNRGRANVAKATYASLAALYLYFRFKKDKSKSVEKATNDTSIKGPEPKSQTNVAVRSYEKNEREKIVETIDKVVNTRQDLHVVTSPSDNGSSAHTSPINPPYNEGNSHVFVGEPNAKFKTKSESTGNGRTTTTSTTPTGITNEQKSIDMDSLW